jgi:DNA ligase 1
MKRFAALYAALDASTATLDKLAALQAYLAEADAADAAWALYFLCGGRPKRVLPSAVMRAAACAEAQIEDWLFEESYQAVGDLAETIALLLPPPTASSSLGLAAWMEERLLGLRGLAAAEQTARLRGWWRELDAPGRFLLGKLIGGGFRVGVSRALVQRALAAHSGLDAKLMAQRLVGFTQAEAAPTAQRYQALLAAADAPARQGEPALQGQPYPFFLAHALPAEQALQDLGDLRDWQVQWKYDGIRAQAIRRGGQSWLWSRGEELIGESFPEVMLSLQALPEGTVLDGELLVWPAGDAAPAPFARLQQRLNRKAPGRKLLAEQPVRLLPYDVLELNGVDLRSRPQHERRAALEALLRPLAAQGWQPAPLLRASSWAELAALRAQSRALGVEGLMLKRGDGAYGSGRTKAEGLWWKWKIEPMVADAVLIYAQAGHGRRASLYTDYTFAVWNRAPRDAAEAQAVVEAIAARQPAQPQGLQLVPFAKAYSGLSDAEITRVDREIRAQTLEKFGPVRSVRPSLVFELGFEGISRSPRHKSGVAVRFPRMLRIRDDKPLHEANCLPDLLAMISAGPG